MCATRTEHYSPGHRPPNGPATPEAAESSVILLHPPLPLAGVSIAMQRGRQQNGGTRAQRRGCSTPVAAAPSSSPPSTASAALQRVTATHL